MQFTVKVRANFPATNYATQVAVKFAVPKSTTGVSFELAKGVQGQGFEYKRNEKICEWQIKKFQGGQEHYLIARVTLEMPNAAECRKEIGPVTMNFEIPMYNVSRLAV